MLPDVPHYIVQPPAVLYTYKNKPALVTCTVKPAVLLYVICADNLTGIDPRNHWHSAEHDRHSNQQYLQPNDINPSMLTYKASQSHINLLQQRKLAKIFASSDSKQVTRIVTASAVEKWFGEFWCQCEAWNNVQELGEPRVKTSPRTSVQLAFLNKRFVRHPKSIRVVLGWSAEFFCQAPNGRPMPKLQWMKDGNRIENGSVRIKILHTLKLNESKNSTQHYQHHQFNTSSDGFFDEGAHAISWLIIHSTEIEDEGVYTCIATNEAGRRTSNQARLTIHVDGKWSEWYDWTQCPVECSSNVTSQQSVGHEAGRQTGELLWDSCPHMCLLHHAQRQRHCNAPKPRGGGRPCLGDAVERISCMELCKRTLISGNKAKTDRDMNKNLSSKEIGLVLFLALAILLFLGSASTVIFLVSRTRCKSTKICNISARYTPNTNFDGAIRYKKTMSNILATDVIEKSGFNDLRTTNTTSQQTQTKVSKSVEPYLYRNLQIFNNKYHVRQFPEYHETVPRMRDRFGKHNLIHSHLPSAKRPNLSSHFPITDIDCHLCTMPNAHFHDLTQANYFLLERKTELSSNVQPHEKVLKSRCVPYNLQCKIPKHYTSPDSSSYQSVVVRKLYKNDRTQPHLKDVDKCGEDSSVHVKLNTIPSNELEDSQANKWMKSETFVDVNQNPVVHQGQ
ncbi:hypothetical protein EG68_00848 [Paragonimus skrjabini miyazakii]|uniref:Ig-like domain-containing protein n=1 Tax=Paragonimus skrjabini miyazakii TaxID=59628 RepID=A0A8S9Z8K5_9TREM|nr:hypothetical protein EG68_00848 [Paragonimus skrjabini miyazakii]